MKRERAVDLAAHLLRNLDANQEEWPLSLLTEVGGTAIRLVNDRHMPPQPCL